MFRTPKKFTQSAPFLQNTLKADRDFANKDCENEDSSASNRNLLF